MAFSDYILPIQEQLASILSGETSAGNPVQGAKPAVAMSSGNSSQGADNSAVAIASAVATSGNSIYVYAVHCSYDDTPTGGLLTIADEAGTAFSIDITTSGPHSFYFDPPLKGSVDDIVTITLSAGGAGIGGALNIVVREAK